MNISQFQSKIESILEQVSHGRNIPSDLADLRFLVPSGSRPELSVRYVSTGRKVREDASFDYFDPTQCEVVIRYIAVEDEVHELASAPLRLGVVALSEPADEMLKALEEAESMQREFVSLTWFRDQYLPGKSGNWVDDLTLRRKVLEEAIEQKLIVTNRVANPKNPLHPVTAIRLNRSHPRFAKTYDRPGVRQRFHPAKISGAPLSRTVIEGRR
jgi:hypothetical protein